MLEFSMQNTVCRKATPAFFYVILTISGSISALCDISLTSFYFFSRLKDDVESLNKQLNAKAMTAVA